MREIERATTALIKEIEAFADQTALLESEKHDANEAAERASGHLAAHLESRKLVLGEFYEDLARAEKADIERQTEMLK